MENSFIELIPAASASESTAKSSALFKKYLASFLIITHCLMPAVKTALFGICCHKAI